MGIVVGAEKPRVKEDARVLRRKSDRAGSFPLSLSLPPAFFILRSRRLFVLYIAEMRESALSRGRSASSRFAEANIEFNEFRGTPAITR